MNPLAALQHCNITGARRFVGRRRRCCRSVAVVHCSTGHGGSAHHQLWVRPQRMPHRMPRRCCPASVALACDRMAFIQWQSQTTSAGLKSPPSVTGALYCRAAGPSTSSRRGRAAAPKSGWTSACGLPLGTACVRPRPRATRHARLPRRCPKCRAACRATIVSTGPSVGRHCPQAAGLWPGGMGAMQVLASAPSGCAGGRLSRAGPPCGGCHTGCYGYCITLGPLAAGQVVVTHLRADAVDVREVDWTRPTAIVLGNERAGERYCLPTHRDAAGPAMTRLDVCWLFCLLGLGRTPSCSGCMAPTRCPDPWNHWLLGTIGTGGFDAQQAQRSHIRWT